MTIKDDTSIGKKIRAVEKELAKGLIRWRVRRSGLPPLDERVLDHGTERLIDEAHGIVKRGSKTILDELKQAKDEFQKAYRGEDEEKESNQKL